MRAPLVAALWAVAALAQTPPDPSGTVPVAAPHPTGIAAAVHNGQTFITWTDPLPGADGQKLRYRLYRSTAGPVTDAASATLVQDGLSLFNNNGQLQTGPLNAANRIDATQPMAKLPGAKAPLSPWTGLAVHTAEAAERAFYAVVAYDRTNTAFQLPSAIVVGVNATAEPVEETVDAIRPVLQRADGAGLAWGGAAGLPMYLCLHASSASSPFPYGTNKVGDLWAAWGDRSMQYADGMQQIWDVYQAAMLQGACGPMVNSPVQTSSLFLQPRDTRYKQSGLTPFETAWIGEYAKPFGGGEARVQLFTENFLLRALGWTLAQYKADPNRVYSAGGSMGAWGTMSFAFHHPEIFAAVFPDRPRWRPAAAMYNVDADNAVTANATFPLLPDGSPYLPAKDSVAFARTGRAPWVGWAIGRQDGYASWAEQVEAVNALKAAKAGFAFCWDTGNHSSNVFGTTIQKQYMGRAPALFGLHQSYPAFHNFSLDANPGNGAVADGDSAGCINGGWNWSGVSETAAAWTASLSNTTVSATATVDVTPRNTQAFRPAAGAQVSWSASTGQSGTAIADEQGLVTAPGVVIQAGKPTSVTFKAQ